MRSYLAGIFLLFFSANALAQATGYVTALGFQGNYRPDCWTPMVVHLDSTLSQADDYQIQVHQLDLDKDTVVYAKTVTLGPQAHSDFWVYFIPQPVGDKLKGGGLPTGADSEARAELAKALKVQLYDKSGRTFLSSLPVGFSINNLDRVRTTMTGGRDARDERLILCVVGQDKPLWTEYQSAVGVIGNPEFVPVRPQDLPESVLGYDAVDAIVWFDADATNISAFGAKALEAIQQYVRLGGQLVVCQPKEEANFGRILPFGDMLPVVLKDDKGEWAVDMRRHDLSPLIRLATGPTQVPQYEKDRWDKLQKSRKTWELAHAHPRPDAVWDENDAIGWEDPAAKPDGKSDDDASQGDKKDQADKADPKDAGDKPDKGGKADKPEKPAAPVIVEVTPYLARRSYGTGSVVWVAQDLGDPVLAGTGKLDALTEGWPHVWDKVFGWNNDTYTAGELVGIKAGNENDSRLVKYGDGNSIDLGGSLLKGMEHTARGAAYIFLAVVFFIGYWIVAGPGSYAFLAARKRKGLSWLVYAASALVATALTVGVVKLVLRGSAEVRHISIVKFTPADPAPDGSPRFNTVVNSRFGLYIPRDGEQHVELKDVDKEKDPTMVMAAGRVSYVIPFAIHPEQLPEDSGFTDRNKYVVNTDLYGTGKPVSIDVPFRSTLKKLQARWAGTTATGIDGTAALIEPRPLFDAVTKLRTGQTGPLVGKLTNRTGQHLSDVYIAWHVGGIAGDWLLWVPSWPKDGVLDLDVEYNSAGMLNPNSGATPENPSSRPLKGTLKRGWAEWWYYPLKRSVSDSDIRWDDHEHRFMQSFPMMAFYDRIGPQEVTTALGMDNHRNELLRRGGRALDMSQELACGKLVVLARGPDQSRIPLPLEVEGDMVEGEGVTLFETALPIDRSALNKPPATQPATKPARAGNAARNAE
jgi:hypothetical protein